MSTEELAERRRHDRWAAKGRARVALPGRKAVVVPCASPFAAIQCAAELWGVPMAGSRPRGARHVGAAGDIKRHRLRRSSNPQAVKTQ